MVFIAHIAPPRRVLRKIERYGKPVYWATNPNGRFPSAKYKTERKNRVLITCGYRGHPPFKTPSHILEEGVAIGDGPLNMNYPHDLKTTGIAVENIK